MSGYQTRSGTSRQLIKLDIDCRVVALESQLLRTGSLGSEEGHDLYILAGHEASY